MKKTILILTIAFAMLTSKANNITVSNISLENLNEAQNWVHVEFDLSWENSWRISSGPSNYDAAWIFIKYRRNNGNWTHGIISQANSSVPAGNTLDVTPDSIGAFIYRDADGSGNMNLQNIQLRWNFGITSTDDIIDIQVFAIEMVYIPEGAFYVGGTTGDEENKFFAGGFSTNTSFQITSENALNIANSFGSLYYFDDNGAGGDQTGTLNASYPKGFNDFYAMKYEVSEAQWVGFFNSLNETQKSNKDLTDANHKNSDAVLNRNTIAWSGGTTNATTTAPDRALNYLNPADVNAYLDWSGLRPMTELEYEKTCRGPILPKPGEFAWGNANINTINYTLINANQSNENIINLPQSTGNAMYFNTNSFNGPLRNGIFASSATNKTRQETGGSYYGVMELSGNLYEQFVTVGTAQGRNFTGLHGNGIINFTTGNGTVANFPNNTTGDGYSSRGGCWGVSYHSLRVSHRILGALFYSGGSCVGFRAARTAP